MIEDAGVEEYDIVVVGSGAGALTAALTAAINGADYYQEPPGARPGGRAIDPLPYDHACGTS